MTHVPLPTGETSSRKYLEAKLREHDEALNVLEQGGGGNFTTENVQGVTVRYSRSSPINAAAGATETTSLYGILGLQLDQSPTPQYLAYLEVPWTQNFTAGGAAIKIVHDGHGDGMYIAMINGISPQTVTAATGNGVTPIVLTIQNHGIGQGDVVTISGATGNTAMNGTWYGVTVIDANTLALPSAAAGGPTGNGTYDASSATIQDINSPVGYEAAAYGDGTVGFLSSMQNEGGRANWQGFVALYQQQELLNYAAFSATNVPNAGFSVTKMQVADTSVDGLTQYRILEPTPRSEERR